MYSGYIVETAAVHDLYANPTHPYTRGLLDSIPKLNERERKRLASIEGLPPNLLEEPKRCPFAPRCPYAIDKCWEENPPLLAAGPKHMSPCWRWKEVREAEYFGEKVSS